MKIPKRLALFTALLFATATGCDDDSGSSEEEHSEDEHDDDDHDGHDHNHENELITTVTLTFTSDAGDVVTASFSDPDGDGGASGTTDRIALAPETTYAVELTLLNELEDENVTEEIAEEAEEHFVFLYGPSVTGPASMGDGLVTHEFDDVETDYAENTVGDDLPVGISSIVTTGAAGSGTLSVLVRHLPPVNDAAQKTAELPDAFARGEEIPGSNDVDVRFELTVE
jgi:hypothetical protein